VIVSPAIDGHDPEIRDVVRLPLGRFGDDRGDLTEVWRASWPMSAARQWNVVRTRAGVLRGVHVHPRHTDAFCVVNGTLCCGLFDARPDSSTVGRSVMLELDGESPELVTIPPGVIHGLAFVTDVTLVAGMDLEYDPADDLAIAWDDPGLGLTWPFDDPILSDRDRAGRALDEMLDELGWAVVSGDS
jgi:dTDP-4-dehydrorhamnose 3,5-epimerase